MFIDTHLHFSKKYYDNLNELYNQTKEQNIIKLITCGYDKNTINEIDELTNKYRNVYASVGFHPSEKNINDNDINNLEKIILNNKKIVAIGEIGLDYYYYKDDKTKEKQKSLFIKQLNLAAKLNMPVIIHMREATNDMIEILSAYDLRGIIHCFSGSYETAKRFNELGYKLGIGGVITYNNSNLSKTIEKLDLKSIVLETDSPYLSPHPLRGKQNTPLNIIYIANKIAEIKKTDIEEVAKITTNNACDLFDLG
ncbi:MAG: TatD family hydrolase [Tenericutes bacterium]|jgi:TatD DNase family protein|nr:TatD family hydrolase [Mycoplasmatota bacterium]